KPGHLACEFVGFLAERLRWLQEDIVGEIYEEDLESFLYASAKGTVCNFQTSLPLPVAVHNDTSDCSPLF
ncbi:J domain-containing protein, partial [Escherichia coli]